MCSYGWGWISVLWLVLYFDCWVSSCLMIIVGSCLIDELGSDVLLFGLVLFG